MGQHPADQGLGHSTTANKTYLHLKNPSYCFSQGISVETVLCSWV